MQSIFDNKPARLPRLERAYDLIMYPFMAQCVRDPNVTYAKYARAQRDDAARFTPHVRR